MIILGIFGILFFLLFTKSGEPVMTVFVISAALLSIGWAICNPHSQLALLYWSWFKWIAIFAVTIPLLLKKPSK